MRSEEKEKEPRQQKKKRRRKGNSHLRFVRHRVFDLPEGGQQASTVGLPFPCLRILQQSEFHGEPVAARELQNLFIRGTDRCETDLLTEVCEFRIREQWCMADQFMADVSV